MHIVNYIKNVSSNNIDDLVMNDIYIYIYIIYIYIIYI